MTNGKHLKTQGSEDTVVTILKIHMYISFSLRFSVLSESENQHTEIWNKC